MRKAVIDRKTQRQGTLRTVPAISICAVETTSMTAKTSNSALSGSKIPPIPSWIGKT